MLLTVITLPTISFLHKGTANLIKDYTTSHLRRHSHNLIYCLFLLPLITTSVGVLLLCAKKSPEGILNRSNWTGGRSVMVAASPRLYWVKEPLESRAEELLTTSRPKLRVAVELLFWFHIGNIRFYSLLLLVLLLLLLLLLPPPPTPLL